MGAAKVEDLPHYTYDDYEKWEGRWELINGIAYAMSPSPIFKHQDISAAISYELRSKLMQCKKCTPVLAVDWKIADDTVVCPDNSVVCGEMKTDFIEETPWIIFEVLSPSTKKVDQVTKYNLYQEQGVVYYVLVDPKKKSAEVYRWGDRYYRLEAKIKYEKYTFDLKGCSLEFDFGGIW